MNRGNDVLTTLVGGFFALVVLFAGLVALFSLF
jgi:hypothetical protein